MGVTDVLFGAGALFAAIIADKFVLYVALVPPGVLFLSIGVWELGWGGRR